MTEENTKPEPVSDPRSKEQLRADFNTAQETIEDLETNLRTQLADNERLREENAKLDEKQAQAREELAAQVLKVGDLTNQLGKAKTTIERERERADKLAATKLSDEQQARVEALKAARAVLEKTGFVSRELADLRNGGAAELVMVANWIIEGDWNEGGEEEAEPEPDGGIEAVADATREKRGYMVQGTILDETKDSGPFSGGVRIGGTLGLNRAAIQAASDEELAELKRRAQAVAIQSGGTSTG